jgi:hypothetical protein
MEFTFESLVIAIFAILPGFVRTAARLVISPDTEKATGEWVASSIVGSLVLNAILLPILAGPLLHVNIGGDAETIHQALAKVSGWGVLKYMGALYAFAVVSGMAGGALAGYSPRELAYRLRLTPISPMPNVFNAACEEVGQSAAAAASSGGQDRLWIRVHRENTVILGRLRKTSVDFDVDKPIEVYLARATVHQKGYRLTPRRVVKERFEGLYFRILPDDLVEVLLASADWDPDPVDDRREEGGAARERTEVARR